MKSEWNKKKGMTLNHLASLSTEAKILVKNMEEKNWKRKI